MVPRTGDVVADLRIGDILGSGASAVVYRATRADGSTCAVKVVAHPDEPRRQRVLRELDLLHGLDHPNIVRLIEGGETPDAVWLALELVDGPTLEAFLAGYAPNDEQVDTLVRGLLTGVAAAHRAGVVHRDLKPSNVLLEPRGDQLIARVADFGIARPLLTGGPRPTRSGAMLGTPAYMAPEQFRAAKEADARADVYALGAILYELVSGVRPFSTDDLVALHDAKRRGDVLPVERLRPNTPEGWALAIARAMDPEPSRRYADAAELLAAWERGPLWSERQRRALAPRPLATDTQTADVARTPAVPPPTGRPAALWAAVGAAAGSAATFGVLAAVALVVAYSSASPVPNTEPLPAVVTIPASPVQIETPEEAPDRVPIVAPTAPPPSAPPSPPPVPAAPVARLDVEGGAAVLVAADERQLPPGEVPPGTYTVRLVDDPDVRLVVTVAEGETRVVRCEPRLRMCR